MRRLRSSKGLTLLELIISASLSAVVLLGAGSMVSASTNLSQSSTNVGESTRRVDATLGELADAIRRGSLASARRSDGTNFASGTTDSGIQIRRVVGFRGTPVTSDLVAYRWDSTTGDVLRVEDAVVSILASHVTAFAITRTADLFTVTLTSRSGPQDDRGRTATGMLQIAARNP